MKKLFEREISIYESLFDVDSSHTITVGQALNRIKKGKSKEKVDQIRRLGTGKERDNTKIYGLQSFKLNNMYSEKIHDTGFKGVLLILTH